MPPRSARDATGARHGGDTRAAPARRLRGSRAPSTRRSGLGCAPGSRRGGAGERIGCAPAHGALLVLDGQFKEPAEPSRRNPTLQVREEVTVATVRTAVSRPRIGRRRGCAWIPKAVIRSGRPGRRQMGGLLPLVFTLRPRRLGSVPRRSQSHEWSRSAKPPLLQLSFLRQSTTHTDSCGLLPLSMLSNRSSQRLRRQSTEVRALSNHGGFFVDPMTIRQLQIPEGLTANPPTAVAVFLRKLAQCRSSIA